MKFAKVANFFHTKFCSLRFHDRYYFYENIVSCYCFVKILLNESVIKHIPTNTEVSIATRTF